MKRETRERLRSIVQDGPRVIHAVTAADALATDAENRALRAEVKRKDEVMARAIRALALDTDACRSATDRETCTSPVCMARFEMESALAPRPKRGGR